MTDDGTNLQRKRKSGKNFGVTERDRFELELEFVQCLASPQYLQWLSQSGWFDRPGSAEFLKYLLYWKRPSYAKYLVYPHCLKFLDMLQDTDFQKSIAREETKELLHCQQFYLWMYFAKTAAKQETNRSKET